jgi:hypothetical protein
MAVIENRVGAVAVAGGVAVAVALTATLIVLGSALAMSTGGATLEGVYERPEAAYVWLIGSLVVGSFVGGRSAASASRLVTRREAALAGLFVWAAITLVVLGIGALWIAAAPRIAWELAPLLDWGLWTLFVAQIASLGATIAGGITSAHAEARSRGKATVKVARRGAVFSSPQSYEQDFFGNASLSTPTTPS